MSAFLETADVEKLTGYVMPSKQLAYCKRNGIAAWLSARNECVVPLAAIEGRKVAANEASWKPDFTKISGRG